MTRNIIKKVPIFILGFTVVVVLTSVIGVSAYRYFQGLSRSMAYDVITQLTAEASNQNELTTNAPDNAISDDLFGYKSPEQDFQEETASTKGENDESGIINSMPNMQVKTASLTDENNNSETKPFSDTTQVREEVSSEEVVESEAEGKKYWREPSNTQEVERTVLLALPSSRLAGSTVTASTNELIDDTSQNNPLPSLEEENNSSPADDELQDEEQPTDSLVSISRDILSTGLDDGENEVILSVQVDSNAPNGLIVVENIPNGWDVVESTPQYRDFDPSTGEIKWLFMGGDVGSKEIHYKVVQGDSSTTGASFSGTYDYNDPKGDHVSMQINGVNGG